MAQAADAAGAVELVDPEGLPAGPGRLAGGDRGAARPTPRSARSGSLRLTPAQHRAAYAGRTVVPVTDALTEAQLERAAPAWARSTLLALVGTGTPELSPVALVRATLAAAALLARRRRRDRPPRRPRRPGVSRPGSSQAYAAYAGGRGRSRSDRRETRQARHLPTRRSPRSSTHDRPPNDEQGLVLFFTGLSGSGKSTLARALVDRLLEQGRRTVTSLDGDVVRRHLSAGLTFSKEDRETNIRRIGWVAAEIARHGGVAVVSPIAPFDETRQQVRAMVDDAGGAFFLVHVATPLEECERRDRKGLYAKARAGEIPEFTGISSPYEEPQDADVRVDTTGRTIEDALDDVLRRAARRGYLDLTTPVVEEPSEARARRHRDQVTDAGPTQGHQALPRPLRLHRQHLPLRLARGPGPPRRTGRHRPGLQQRRHPRLDRPRRRRGHARGAAGRRRHAGFRSRPLTRQILEEADLVLTTEAAHRSFILDDHPQLFRKVYTLGQFAEAVAKAPTA